jgi:membrane protease YdiL (CAAX protease family)
MMDDVNWKTDSPEFKNLVLFFVITFTWSWTIWFVMNQGWIPIPEGIGTNDVDITGLLKVLPILILSPFGPTIAALTLSYRSHGREGLRKIWKNLTYWRISPKWFAVILLLQPMYFLVIRLISHLQGVIQPTPEWFTQPLVILEVLVLGVLHGGLSEEIGWRGYALPRLQSRFNASESSLIMGVLEGLWHVPLAVSSWGPISGLIILVLILWQTIASFWRAWIFNNTNGSIFAAVLFHAVQNTAPTIVPVNVFVAPWIPDLIYVPLILLIVGYSIVGIILGLFGYKEMIRGT